MDLRDETGGHGMGDGVDEDGEDRPAEGGGGCGRRGDGVHRHDAVRHERPLFGKAIEEAVLGPAGARSLERVAGVAFAAI